MSYKPNYCPHCGEKIERYEKRFLNSWFCENCEGAFQTVDWMPRIGMILGGVAVLFGFGSYLKTPEKPVNLTANQFTVSASNKSQSIKNEQTSVNSNVSSLAVKSNVQVNTALQNQAKTAPVKKEISPPIQGENTQITESEPVYFCGAQTKKGNPCTRKVKGGGRCWQHTGLPAMLPKEKLVSSQ
jgi:hypothetical protein